MALYKPGAAVSEVSGKIGGTVFARNAGGLYMRNLGQPTGLTPAQSGARERFGLAATTWRTILPANRAEWNAYAANTPMVNRFGDTIYLSGFDHFVRYGSLVKLAQPAFDYSTATAPASPGVGDLINAAYGDLYDDSGLAAVSQVLLEDLSGLSTDSNDQVFVWCSPPLSAGVTFFNGPWKLFFAGPADAAEISGGLIETNKGVVFTAGEFRAIRLRQITERKVSAFTYLGIKAVIADPVP